MNARKVAPHGGLVTVLYNISSALCRKAIRTTARSQLSNITALSINRFILATSAFPIGRLYALCAF